MRGVLKLLLLCWGLRLVLVLLLLVLLLLLLLLQLQVLVMLWGFECCALISLATAVAHASLCFRDASTSLGHSSRHILLLLGC